MVVWCVCVFFVEFFVVVDLEVDVVWWMVLCWMKVVVVGFLVGVIGVFFVCCWVQVDGVDYVWLGYLGVVVEVGMVGVLVDWFVVIVLFKYLLGILILYMVIIKCKKDQLGEGLGIFVWENFLLLLVVEIKLCDVQILSWFGKWLLEVMYVQWVVVEIVMVLWVLVELLCDEDIQQVIDWMIVCCIVELQWGLLVGWVLVMLLVENWQEVFI